MNRLQHFLKAKTQYNLHSPFVYRLYTEILFSRVKDLPKGSRYQTVVWRLEHYYGVETLEVESKPLEVVMLESADGVFQVVKNPHRCEERWARWVESSEWQVTIDLFDVGIAVKNSRLSYQHFLLR